MVISSQLCLGCWPVLKQPSTCNTSILNCYVRAYAEANSQHNLRIQQCEKELLTVGKKYIICTVQDHKFECKTATDWSCSQNICDHSSM